MITFKDWSISFTVAALLVCNPLNAEDATLSFALTPEKVLAGERARLEIRLTRQSNTQEDFTPTIFDDLLMQSEAFLVLNRGYSLEGNDAVWKYELTAYQQGFVSIPPVQVKWGANTFSTENIRLEILSSRSHEDHDIREEFGKVRMPVDVAHWLRVVLFGLIAGVCLRLLFFLFERIPWRTWLKKTPSTHTDPPLAAEEWLRRELALLRASLESNANVDEVLNRFTVVLKTYYRMKSSLPVECFTSREFDCTFKDDRVASRLTTLFRRCDEHKFSWNKCFSPRELVSNGISESESLLLCGHS